MRSIKRLCNNSAPTLNDCKEHPVASKPAARYVVNSQLNVATMSDAANEAELISFRT
ncbi:MAG TPA: hypothetical protein VHC19_19405 [Pirellulales bacterium]|nr:hypothetical protein [Pirellulales bacterium]